MSTPLRLKMNMPRVHAYSAPIRILFFLLLFINLNLQISNRNDNYIW